MQRYSTSHFWGIVYTLLIALILLIATFVWGSVQRAMTSDFHDENHRAVATEVQQAKIALEKMFAEIFSEIAHHSAEVASGLDPSDPSATAIKVEIPHFDPWSLDVAFLRAAPLLRSGLPTEGVPLIYLPDWVIQDAAFAAQFAIASRQNVLVGPVEFEGKADAFLAIVPIFESAASSQSAGLIGVATSTFSTDDIFGKESFLEHVSDVDIAVRATNPAEAADAQGAMLYGDMAVFNSAPVVMALSMPGTALEIAGTPKGGWPTDPPHVSEIRFFFALGIVLISASLVFAARYLQKSVSSDRRLREALEAMNGAFAFYDHNDRLSICNTEYLRFYSIPPEALKQRWSFERILGKLVDAGTAKDAHGREQEWIAARLRRHREGSMTAVQPTSDGRWIKVSETRTSEGETIGFLVDVTDLVKATEKSEAANHAKSEFLNIVSHELKTPLTIVLGYLRFLANPRILPSVQNLVAANEGSADSAKVALQLDEVLSELQGYAARAGASAKSLQDMIQSILDLSALDAGKIGNTAEKIDLAALVASVAEDFKARAEEKKLVLGTDIHPVTVSGNRHGLRRILANLVDNAIKFTEAGRVDIAIEQGDQCIELIVSDTGPGISAEFQQRVFDPFLQVEESLTRKSGGLGLGLAVAHRFSEYLGLHIKVSSNLGVGTTFRVTIPVQAEATEG